MQKLSFLERCAVLFLLLLAGAGTIFSVIMMLAIGFSRIPPSEARGVADLTYLLATVAGASLVAAYVVVATSEGEGRNEL